jgi:hypothetical protein
MKLKLVTHHPYLSGRPNSKPSTRGIVAGSPQIARSKVPPGQPKSGIFRGRPQQMQAVIDESQERDIRKS